MTNHSKLKALTLIAMLCFLVSLRSPADVPLGAGPEFSLFTTSGKHVSQSDYKDQFVVLNFWAFWCDTWKKELPSLIELSGDEQQDHFKLLAISVDGSRLPVFEHDTNGIPIPFPVLLDNNGAVSNSYRVTHVPTVIILDKYGKIRYSTYGYPGNHVLLGILRKLESAEP